MAAGKQLLDFVSYSGADPELPLDDDNFGVLESALGRAIGHVARQSLRARCNAYLLERRIELARQSWQDVEACLAPYRAAAKALWSLAYEQESRSDASFKLGSIMDGVFRQQPIRFNAESELLHIKPDCSEAGIVPFSTNYQLPDGPYYLALSDRLIQEIAMSLKVAVNLAERSIEEHSKETALEPRRTPALDLLIISLTDWARSNYLPISPYSTKAGYEPAPFSKFVAELLALMPPQYREQKHTYAGGIAEKIRRVRSAHKQRALEQIAARPE